MNALQAQTKLAEAGAEIIRARSREATEPPATEPAAKRATWEPRTEASKVALKALELALRAATGTSAKAAAEVARLQRELDAVAPLLAEAQRKARDLEALDNVRPEDLVSIENVRRAVRAHEAKREELAASHAEAEDAHATAKRTLTNAVKELTRGRFALAARELHERAVEFSKECEGRLDELLELREAGQPHGVYLTHPFEFGEYRDNVLQKVARGLRRIEDGLDLAP